MRQSAMSARARSHGSTRATRAPSPPRRPRRSPNRRSRSPNKSRNRRSAGGRSPPSRRRPGSTSPRRRRSPSPRNKLGQPMRPRRMSKSPVRRPISPIRRAFSPVTGPFRPRGGPPQDRRSPRRHLASPKRGRSRSRTRSRSPSVIPLSPVHRAQLSPLRSRAQMSPVGRIPDKLALSPPPQHMRPIRGVGRAGPGPYRVESSKVLESSYRSEVKREEAPRNEAGVYRPQRESALGPQMPAMGPYDDRGKRERYLAVGGSGMAREGPADAAGLDTDLRHRSGRSPSPLADSFSQSDKRYSAIPLLDGTTQAFRDHKSSAASKTVEESNRRMGYDLNLEDRPLVGERFCGGENAPASGRMYTHEELKKITVDIRRTVPSTDSPPGMSRVINPHNVVVVRRPEEGARPIFDRDEIRQAHGGHGSSYRGKGGEGDFAERRVVAIVKERSRSPHSESSSTRKHPAAPGAGIDEREDFQVSRERYESFGPGDDFRKGNEQRRPTTLSEKWATYSERGRLQGPQSAVEKPVAPSQQMRSTVGGYFSSGERVEIPARSQYSPDRRSPSMMFRSRSPDTSARDAYLEDRMRSGMYAQQQPDRHSSQHQHHHHHHELQSEYARSSEDSRHQLGGKRRSQIGEVVRNRHSSPPLFERRTDRQPDDMWDNAARKRFRDDDRNAPDTTTDAFYRESYRDNVGGVPRTDKDLFRQEMKDTLDSNLPNFASRPDKYRYQEWIDKPDMVPKGPSYYEHDTRGESSYDSSWFGRGRGRGTVAVRGRARGRATPFVRGRILTRGGGNGGGVGGGGRGMMMTMPNRRKPSPNQWKHDMFDEISPDRKSEQDNKPTSTTEGK